MFTIWGDVKLIDLGYAESFHSKRFDESVGTPSYMSPQVYKYDYNEKCDMWAIGVILYEALTGLDAFPGERSKDVKIKVKIGKWDLTPLRDLNLSKNVIDFITQSLQYKEKDRISS